MELFSLILNNIFFRLKPIFNFFIFSERKKKLQIPKKIRNKNGKQLREDKKARKRQFRKRSSRQGDFYQ